MSTIIRQLQPDDWQIWRAIRLEALQNHPDAFGASYQDSLQQSEQDIRKNLENNFVLGAFIGDELVGTSRFHADKSEKQRHRGYLTAVYLREKHRGQGIADGLITAIIDHAKGHVIQLHCGVAVKNTPALKLYQKHGFTIYGTEPRSLLVDGTYYDEYLMVRMLDQ